jgi:hypothetical protein
MLAPAKASDVSGTLSSTSRYFTFPLSEGYKAWPEFFFLAAKFQGSNDVISRFILALNGRINLEHC